MLNVKKPEEVNSVISENFIPCIGSEEVKLQDALGRILACDIKSQEFIPAFNRSTVDGYAIKAKDSFGASSTNSIILTCKKEIQMGEAVDEILNDNECMYVPTGGMLPENADAVVMIEYTENYGNNEIGILKAVAPSENVIFKGEDARPDEVIIHKGKVLSSKEIGALADLGYEKVSVFKKPLIGIISTGDELVDSKTELAMGQARDVNSDLLYAFAKEESCEAISYGIVKDSEELLLEKLKEAISECDLVLVSGGSSAGMKDKTASVIANLGEVYFHGIAIKPGKPTILGKINNKPVVGLPGHPVAAYFISKLYVSAIISRLLGLEFKLRTIPAIASENISANQGRALCVAVKLENVDGRLIATPARSKSGLITTIAETDGFVLISRSSEGVLAGGLVDVISILK